MRFSFEIVVDNAVSIIEHDFLNWGQKTVIWIETKASFCQIRILTKKKQHIEGAWLLKNDISQTLNWVCMTHFSSFWWWCSSMNELKPYLEYFFNYFYATWHIKFSSVETINIFLILDWDLNVIMQKHRTMYKTHESIPIFIHLSNVIMYY